MSQDKVFCNEVICDEALRGALSSEHSSLPAGFKRTNHLECVRQRGGSDFAFESLLHLVERRDDA